MIVEWEAEQKTVLNAENGEEAIISQHLFVIIVCMVPKKTIVSNAEDIWAQTEFMLIFVMIGHHAFS